jgi:predicted nucleic acid-binding protein
MIALDTSIVSEELKPRPVPRVTQWLGRKIQGTLYLTSTSLAELLVGVEILPASGRKSLLARELNHLLEILFERRILRFDRRAAEAFSKISAQGRADGKSLPFGYGQIAAIAQVHGFMVATRDTGPFEEAGVAYIHPWQV